MIYNCDNCRFRDSDRKSDRCLKCATTLNGEDIPSEWMVTTAAQALERKIMGESSNQLCGNMTNGYKYLILPRHAGVYVKDILNSEYGLASIKAKEAAMTRIKKVIFNNPATIVFWYDGTKTVVKCGEGETFDPEKGLAMAISKYFFNNAGWYYNVFKKWLPKDED